MIPFWVRSIPIWVYATVLALGVIGWQRIEVGHYRAKALSAKAQVAAIKAQAAADLSAQKAHAESMQKAQAAATAAAERQMMQDNADAEQKYQDTIAGLRAGTVRLRHEWTCPSVPAAAASTAKPDGDTALREQGASDLVRLAAEADAQIRALQAVLMGERQ